MIHNYDKNTRRSVLFVFRSVVFLSQFRRGGGGNVTNDDLMEKPRDILVVLMASGHGTGCIFVLKCRNDDSN